MTQLLYYLLKFYPNVMSDISALLNGENITYLNLQKFNQNNYISGFNYNAENTSINITNNSIMKSEIKFTCILDDVINKLLEINEKNKFTLCISIGVIEYDKFHEVIFDRIYESEFEEKNQSNLK